MANILKIVIFALAARSVSCTIAGLSYMDPLNYSPRTAKPGSDPCNPLYWYPKAIPEYCYIKSTPMPQQAPMPVPLPIPIPIPEPLIPVEPIGPIAGPQSFPIPPLPPPLPLPLPPPMLPFPMMPPPMMPPPMMPPPMMPPPMMPPPMMPAPMMPSPMMPSPMMPSPVMPSPLMRQPMVPPVMMPPPIPPVQVPYGLPIIPNGPLLPVAGVPFAHMPQQRSFFPFNGRQVGMVPGISGLVSRDGGINILPFSDAYSDMLEKHKNKILRKRLRKVIKDYDEKSYRRWNRRSNNRRRMDYR